MHGYMWRRRINIISYASLLLLLNLLLRLDLYVAIIYTLLYTHIQ